MSETPLTYAELFAGAGGLSMGLELAGWDAVAHAEIEPHARAVLRKHWPDCRLDGDVSAVNGADYRGTTLLSGGSPCQDLSVAGKRSGMTEGSGTRSSLYFEQVRIWQESGAPYFLWENVLGAFSSNNGRDFAAVLSALVGAAIPVPADGWQSGGVAAGPTGVAAWRVLDAQFFGVSQRRRRVFVLGARAGGVDPAEVLAVSEGLRGDFTAGGQAWESITADARGGVEGAGVIGWDDECNADGRVVGSFAVGGAASATRRAGVVAFHPTQDPINGPVSPALGVTTGGMNVLAFAENQRGETRTSDIMPQVTVGGGKTGQGYPAILAPPAPPPQVVPAHPPLAVTVAFRTDQEPELSGVDVCHTLDTGSKSGGGQIPAVLSFKPSHYTRGKDGAPSPIAAPLSADADRGDQEQVVIVLRNREGKPGPLAFDTKQDGASASEIAPTLTAMQHRDGNPNGGGQMGVLVPGTFRMVAFGEYTDDGTASTVKARDFKDATDLAVPASGIPRRLMPIETERLMGWPDHHTALGIDEDGREYALSDTARYRLCGNGVASPVAAWIGWRLRLALHPEPTPKA
jgi:site-specific DNA-cytosine methylase